MPCFPMKHQIDTNTVLHATKIGRISDKISPFMGIIIKAMAEFALPATCSYKKQPDFIMKLILIFCYYGNTFSWEMIENDYW